MQHGRCQCNHVTYQYKGEPLTCYACHCTDCQTATGTAFTLSMIVKADEITVESGEISVQAFQHNGSNVERHHCSRCGTALWFTAKEFPGIAVIKPGTFDDTTWFRPIAHLWVRSKQPWLTLDSSIKQYQQQPPINELMALWAAQSG